MAQPAYVPGGTGTQNNYSFVSSYDAVKLDIDPELTLRYGRQRLTGLLDLFGYRKATNALEYSHYEQDRTYPKIKATTAGAGANVAATFTVDTSATTPYTLDPSPYTGTPVNANNYFPARVGDIIYIKPAAGSVSFGSYIQAIVTEVTIGSGVTASTFKAIGTDGATAIPAIASADEIIIVGNAHGEGSNQPLSRSFKSTKYTNQLQIFKDTLEITGTNKDIQKWFEDPKTGQMKYMLAGEEETYNTFMNGNELNLLVNQGLVSPAVADAYASAGTPISMNKGLIPEVITRGNEYNYSGTAGLTVGDLDEIVLILDKQKGAKENIMLNGIALNGQIDRELGDRFKNGGISYGMFKADEKKAVDLGFSSVHINGYSFHKKPLDAFNDLQSLGADGFGFPYEGMILPADMTASGEAGVKVPSLRTRFLENQEFESVHIDGFRQFETGRDVHQVRYKSTLGIEAFGLNRAMYIKRA